MISVSLDSELSELEGAEELSASSFSFRSDNGFEAVNGAVLPFGLRVEKDWVVCFLSSHLEHVWNGGN